MLLYKFYPIGSSNFELSKTQPKGDFDVVWVNKNNLYTNEDGELDFQEDGSINYEDNSELFPEWPSFSIEGIKFDTNSLTFVKGADGIDYCIVFWPSDVTLEFFVNISRKDENGTCGNVDDYDEHTPIMEYADNVDELIELISTFL